VSRPIAAVLLAAAVLVLASPIVFARRREAASS
jgi:hypothetical protein